MFKKILIPVDLSAAEKGKVMIEAASELGGKSAQLTLINVVEDIPAYVAYELPQGILETTRENAQTQIDDMANASGRKIATEVRAGSPATAILDAAQEIGGGFDCHRIAPAGPAGLPARLDCRARRSSRQMRRACPALRTSRRVPVRLSESYSETPLRNWIPADPSARHITRPTNVSFSPRIVSRISSGTKST